MILFRICCVVVYCFIPTGFSYAGQVRVTVAEYSKGTGPYFNEAAQIFEKSHPGISVKIEVVPWDNLQQKLTTDISANQNSDLAIIGTRWLLDYVSQGLAAPLDAYETPEFKNRLIDRFLAPSIIDGKLYGLPIAASARAMYYNKDHFKKIGLDAPPKTWPEFVSAAQKMKAVLPDVFPFGLQGRAIEAEVYYYYALWSFGGDILKGDSSGLNSEAARQAANLYANFIRDGIAESGVTSNSREDVQNLFKLGKVATVITAPFLSNQIKTEAPHLNYGIAPIPVGPDQRQFTYGVTDSIVMFENSTNKAEAWQFLDFLFTTEQRTKFDKIEGFLPVNVREAADPFFSNDPDLKAFTALLPDAHFAPLIKGTDEIAQTTIDAVQTIYLNSAAIDMTLKQAAAKIDGILGQKN